MRLLVTGGCGFLGSNFVRYVLEHYGPEMITNVDSLATGTLAVGKVLDEFQGVLTGTPDYFAPEVARGAPPTPEADVFSLGATLYISVEGLLAGRASCESQKSLTRWLDKRGKE